MGNIAAGPDVWAILSAIANVVLGGIALFLLYQGQRDRQKLAEERRAEQAKKVTLSIEQIKERSGPNSYNILGMRAFLRNDSDKPVFLGFLPTITFYKRPDWNTYVNRASGNGLFETKHVNLDFSRLEPGQHEVIQQDLIGYDGAWLRFTDSEGVGWIRTGDDGKLFQEQPRRTRRSIFYQWLCRFQPLGFLLITWPHRYATWRFKRAKGIPWVARWIRFWWGYAPIGELDPYMLPRNAPKDEWHYTVWKQMSRRTE